MNEEEKKSIEILETEGTENHYLEVQIVLHLIEKQQKEIEELKDKNKTLENLLQGNLYEMYLYYKELAGKYQANCISKDTIKEKIKEYSNDKYEFLVARENIITILNELLEE
jgi:predicted choloylglycine hydrolase